MAIAQSDTWYKDIYKVGAKTAEDIERKLRYFGFPGAGEDEGQLKWTLLLTEVGQYRHSEEKYENNDWREHENKATENTVYRQQSYLLQRHAEYGKKKI